MNEQMIEHLIFRIGDLEKKSNNTESRLSKAEQQMEIIRSKHKWMLDEIARLRGHGDAQDDSGETVTKCTTY